MLIYFLSFKFIFAMYCLVLRLEHSWRRMPWNICATLWGSHFLHFLHFFSFLHLNVEQDACVSSLETYCCMYFLKIWHEYNTSETLTGLWALFVFTIVVWLFLWMCMFLFMLFCFDLVSIHIPGWLQT